MYRVRKSCSNDMLRDVTPSIELRSIIAVEGSRFSTRWIELDREYRMYSSGFGEACKGAEMTPQSFVRTPSLTAEDASEPPASDPGSDNESLPPHTSEIGTLKKLPNSGTSWVGSSSGVYFVNTVRRAFSAALLDANASTIPASEDILTGEDADGRNYNGPVAGAGHSVTEGDFRRVMLASLGRPPADRELAMELVTSFFRCWHPLFPFMHGPRFLQDIELIYSMPDVTATGTFSPVESRRLANFQLIINIASLDRKDIHLPIESRIKSTSDVTRVAGCFSVNHDIASIQLLIAAELYLVATISLRQASTVAGMILKLIYHAGLHRCPLRYAALSLEDCEIRKRIFWSAYALDRHLSLSLGDPNTVQDSDIDVCLSGRELHKAVAQEFIINPADELKMHMPQPQSGPHGSGPPSDDPRVVNMNEGSEAREKAQREAAMTAYVHYGKLTGRIIEIFHKSIHARFQTPEAITFLNSDIETWWNDLPAAFTNEDDEDDQTTSSNRNNDDNPSTSQTPYQTHKQLKPFFQILYHQLLLLLNRPRLSLDQSTAEFQHGLQICIKASRNTLTALRKHRDNGQSMLLPGLLSATWMAGLIIAFACQLGKYPKARAVADISNCLIVLESMGFRDWFTVKNCHKVLSLLLSNIKSRRAGRDGFLSVNAVVRPSRKRTIDDNAGLDSGSPRKKLDRTSPGHTRASAGVGEWKGMTALSRSCIQCLRMFAKLSEMSCHVDVAVSTQSVLSEWLMCVHRVRLPVGFASFLLDSSSIPPHCKLGIDSLSYPALYRAIRRGCQDIACPPRY
ncbi:hypothetical protein Dsin_033003 [Dipteronia sinensis]|uniref:Xylanolytic transcriptional activator regulatory domain-containing protein n=1 Tax=Dipteronia sinensis TaxID=43782 RepID=A0AAD9Z683_9ROSI|nr:hypothetical protein Dsin_033003 [Dipteronia sinensis]